MRHIQTSLLMLTLRVISQRHSGCSVKVNKSFVIVFESYNPSSLGALKEGFAADLHARTGLVLQQLVLVLDA